MAVELTDVFRAASLIQWGLQPRMRPLQNAEYRELVREYMNRSEFRDIVAEMSDGLGLYVLNVSEHGIVLTPREGSVFWMRPSELRTGSSATTDRRLLDGIVQMTIAATVFPRARDLEDDVNRPRPPVTVDEIDDTLRAICASLKKEFANVDPDMDDVRTGIYDAWRVYDSTLAVRETKDGREASSTSTRIIKYNLEKLKEYGCFSETRYAGKEAWQPTRRYNVLVQDIAASRIYDEVMRIQAKYAQNGDDDDRGLFDHLESNDAVRDDADIAYHRDVDGDSPSDTGLPLVDGDQGDGQMAVDFDAEEDAESSTASKADHPLVDEHGIEYAEGYFDGDHDSIFDDSPSEYALHAAPRAESFNAPNETASKDEKKSKSAKDAMNAKSANDVREYKDVSIEYSESDRSIESSTASKADHPLVDEHGIEYAEGYFDDEPVSIFDDDAPDKA